MFSAISALPQYLHVLESQEGLKPFRNRNVEAVSVGAQLESQEGLKHSDVSNPYRCISGPRISRRVETHRPPRRRRRCQSAGARISRRIETVCRISPSLQKSSLPSRISRRIETIYPPRLSGLPAQILESQEGLKRSCRNCGN